MDPGGRLAWVQLPFSPHPAGQGLCVGGRYSELSSPTLEVLLGVIEETEKLIRTKGTVRVAKEISAPLLTELPR